MSEAAGATEAGLSARLAALEQAHAALQETLARTAAECEQYRTLYQDLLEAYEKLKRGLLGQQAERLPPDGRQLTLDLLATLLGADAVSAPPVAQPVRSHTRTPAGRKPLPAHLPRVEVELIPLEVQQQGLDQFERIGAEVSEVLERRPASAVIVHVIRPKFVRKDRRREGPTPVLIAAPADLPITRGLAGPGMLADSIVRRWQDHQPLHRLESIYARDGLALARSTLCGWHAELAALARPLVDAMRADAFAQPVLCTDATGVLVQAKEKCRTGHFWVLVAPARHVLFGYSPRHDSAGVDQLLAGYQGYLVADAHAVYDHLYADGSVVEVGCWAHQRRYFFKALGSEPARAREALAMIGALFGIERPWSGRRTRIARRSGASSRRRWSLASSPGATAWPITCSTRRRSPPRSATPATSGPRSPVFSTTRDSRSITTSVMPSSA
jgi:transposase